MNKTREDMMHELILKRSEGVFLKHGYNGTTMDMIAESCQISKPTLYKYFPSKYELFMYLSLHAEQDILNSVIDLLTKAQEKERALEQIIDYLFQMVEEKGDFFRMGMREHHLIVNQENIDQHIEYYTRTREELIKSISGFISGWIQPEVLELVKLEIATATIYDILNGLVMDLLFQNRIDRESYKRFFVHFLKHGLMKEA